MSPSSFKNRMKVPLRIKKMPQSGVGSLQGSNEDCLPIKGHTRGGTHPLCNPTNGHTYFQGESNLAEQFRQITHYLAEQFHQITHYLREQFRQIAHYLAELCDLDKSW